MKVIKSKRQLKAIVIKNLLTAQININNAQNALKSILKDEMFLSEIELNALYDYGVLKAQEEVARLASAKKAIKAITGNLSYGDVYKLERKVGEIDMDDQPAQL